jgi:hypothetical protein
MGSHAYSLVGNGQAAVLSDARAGEGPKRTAADSITPGVALTA